MREPERVGVKWGRGSVVARRGQTGNTVPPKRLGYDIVVEDV